MLWPQNRENSAEEIKKLNNKKSVACFLLSQNLKLKYKVILTIVKAEGLSLTFKEDTKALFLRRFSQSI